jgi:Na+/H+ antiporter NhaD/arsenite permease-like protein
MNVALLVIFYLWDQRQLKWEDVATREALKREGPAQERLGVEGQVNFLLLLGVLAVAFIVGRFGEEIGLQSEHARKWGQVIGMGLLAMISILMTRRETRAINRFTFQPIIEVAVLFAGIFAAMILPWRSWRLAESGLVFSNRGTFSGRPAPYRASSTMRRRTSPSPRRPAA